MSARCTDLNPAMVEMMQYKTNEYHDLAAVMPRTMFAVNAMVLRMIGIRCKLDPSCWETNLFSV